MGAIGAHISAMLFSCDGEHCRVFEVHTSKFITRAIGKSRPSTVTCASQARTWCCCLLVVRSCTLLTSARLSETSGACFSSQNDELNISQIVLLWPLAWHASHVQRFHPCTRTVDCALWHNPQERLKLPDSRHRIHKSTHGQARNTWECQSHQPHHLHYVGRPAAVLVRLRSSGQLSDSNRSTSNEGHSHVPRFEQNTHCHGSCRAFRIRLVALECVDGLLEVPSLCVGATRNLLKMHCQLQRRLSRKVLHVHVGASVQQELKTFFCLDLNLTERHTTKEATTTSSCQWVSHKDTIRRWSVWLLSA